MKISECMCKDVCFVKPDCNVFDAARIMNENHIGCIPICDEKKALVGLLTDRDIVLRAVACNKDYKTTPVSEIMTTNVCTCRNSEDIDALQEVMKKNQVRRIPIVDENNKMIGIITMGDLSRYSHEIGKQSFVETIENICECKGSTKNCG